MTIQNLIKPIPPEIPKEDERIRHWRKSLYDYLETLETNQEFGTLNDNQIDELYNLHIIWG